MKIIEHLSDLINEEIDGACNYAKLALKYKEERPQLAQTFYNLTVDEMKHIDMLHDEVVKIINDHKATGAEVPVEMQAVYDYVHAKQIDRVHNIKVYMDQYKD
jgi:rubrerythrin